MKTYKDKRKQNLKLKINRELTNITLRTLKTLPAILITALLQL